MIFSDLHFTWSLQIICNDVPSLHTSHLRSPAHSLTHKSKWSAEGERKENSILLGEAPRNQSFTTKIIAAKHKPPCPRKSPLFSQIWGEEHQPCWICWCTQITFIELYNILGVLLYPWCVHFVSCLAWEAPWGTECIWLLAGLLPFLPAREGWEKSSACHVSVVQSLPRSQAQLLHLCWCCLGLPGCFPQALGMTHSDKHNSENSREEWVSSQNLGQILPLHIWSFNLWTSVPFLTVFHSKKQSTIQ